VKGFESLRDGFLPRWDRAYTALIEDLESAACWNRRWCVAWGEFGRTPRVNNNAGRDHYPNVFSAALAGGKVQGGRVVGSKGASQGPPHAAARRPTAKAPAAPSARSPSAMS
jgi:uncharacterized protein (DUF1501 family)